MLWIALAIGLPVELRLPGFAVLCHIQSAFGIAGKVAECGTHQQLIDLRGRCANTWMKSIPSASTEREAQMMTERAEMLQ